MKPIKNLWMLLVLGLAGILNVNAQLSQNWFNEDPSKDRFAGVSSDLAHEKLLKGRTSTPVIVAVIDGGTDVTHPDLKDNIWVNEKEIAGNNIDDDRNGYADDINGWSFIGGKSGDVGYDTFEATRLYKKYKSEFEGKSSSSLTAEQKSQLKQYTTAKETVEKELKEAKAALEIYSKLKTQLDNLKTAMGTEDFKADDVANFKSSDEEFNKLKAGIAGAMSKGVSFDEIYKDIEDSYKHFHGKVYYQYNTEFDSRTVIGDDYENYTDRYYGSSNVTGPDASHGTHVAGIIGAVRDNNTGIKGIADNVQLMIIRVVPDGDERDKDVANAIRYAADNGAKVINMSFGKSFSPGKKYVDEAMRYAASKDVLMVHGAGNDGSNIDKASNFPNPFYESSSTREPAWIEVGASSSSGDAAAFSNYGAEKVDVFAPGVKIYSTMPGGTYENQNGTSMASPVVAGIAALIRSYYPKLTAPQVRQAIMESAIKLDIKTTKPGSKKKVKYKKLCASAGIANAYRALLVADAMSK